MSSAIYTIASYGGDIRNGLLHKWSFNQASGLVSDYGGTVNGTAVNGASFATLPASPDGSQCLCVSNASADSGVDLGPASNVATPNGSFTISGWIYLTSVTYGTAQHLLGSYPGGAFQDGVFRVDAEVWGTGALWIRAEGQNFRRPELPGLH